MASWGDFVHPSTWGKDIHDGIQSTTNMLGLTHAAPPNPANSVDAQNARTLARAFLAQSGRPGAVEQTIAPTRLDQTQSDQARQVGMNNLTDLQGVASGVTPTAADALLTRGTDEAATRARGLAAAYSRGNPGAALRAGLAAGNAAQAQAAATAAQQKAEEQAQARGAIGSLSGAMRQSDLAAASANQNAANDAAKANQAANLQQQGLNNQFQLGMSQLGAQETNAPLQAQIANTQAINENNKTNQQGTGAAFQGAGALLSMLSDKKAKTKVKRKSFADAMGDKIHGVTFEYKPEHGGTKHEGVIAQEVEAVFPGAVKKGGDGLRRVDTGHLSLASAGALAEMNRRLRKVEARQ